jgi:nuclear pore complex protein Nup54
MLGQSTSNNSANDAQILAERITAISNAWNPASFDNKFLFYLYNVSDVPLSTPLSSLPLPPQVAASPRLASLYKQAVLESPRPKDYLPVLASSFDDLQKRVDIQKSTSQAHLAKLKSGDVKGKIDQANKKHWNETLVRIERLSREQVKLEERLVRMCAKLAGLHPSSSSSSSGSASSLSASGAGAGTAKDDGELLIMLEHIRNELNGHNNNNNTHRANGSTAKQMSRPAGNTNRLANIVSELWMVVSQRKAALANSQRSGTPENYGEYRVQDQGELNKVLEVCNILFAPYSSLLLAELSVSDIVLCRSWCSSRNR